tara:strand:+ start:60 stop:239 length:180 start_codon:yes stop_codon:yes gene_type:complete
MPIVKAHHKMYLSQVVLFMLLKNSLNRNKLASTTVGGSVKKMGKPKAIAIRTTITFTNG